MEKVYILGAGSSAGAGAPLVRDFKSSVEEIIQRDGREAYPRMTAALDLWNKTAPAADVEEFYILEDLLGRLEAGYHSQMAVEGVRYLIAKTLELSMGREISETHRKFVHKAWDISQGRGDFAVITLNWDLAVDNASYTHSQFSLDYGYDKARSFDEDSERRHRKRFRLLKLHGSLNWWICQSKECQTLWYRQGEKDVSLYWEQTEGRQCERCGNNLLPLMVPPTGQKFEHPYVDPSPLRVIWKEAREGMKGCQELAIVGYSFRPTDVQFRMFLLEALSGNKDLKRILVISSPKFGSQRRRFEDIYDGVFAQSPHRQALQFAYRRFEDWVEGGMPFDVEGAGW